MSDFGHRSIRMAGAIIDCWGEGPFTLRAGKRRYYFSDSDMFGPLLEGKHGKVLDVQPVSEKHPFWAPYHMWRKFGRKGKKVGRYIVCRWRAPRPGKYWKDDMGLSHVIADPEYDGAGFVRVPPPNVDRTP